MNPTLVALFAFVVSSFRTRAALQIEVRALRQQLAVLQANSPRRLCSSSRTLRREAGEPRL